MRCMASANPGVVDAVAETVELHRMEGDAYPLALQQSESLLVNDAIADFEIPGRASSDEVKNIRALREIWAEAD